MSDDKKNRWDLSPIYPSVDSEEFKEDLARLKNLLAGFGKSLADKNADLEKLIGMRNEVADLSETLTSYTYCNVSVNTTDKAAVNALNKVEELSVDLATCDTMFNTFVADQSMMAKARRPRLIFPETGATISALLWKKSRTLTGWILRKVTSFRPTDREAAE